MVITDNKIPDVNDESGSNGFYILLNPENNKEYILVSLDAYKEGINYKDIVEQEKVQYVSSF